MDFRFRGNNKKEKNMDKIALERSDQVFYQYEARKVFDYLKEKGVKNIKPGTAISEALNK